MRLCLPILLLLSATALAQEPERASRFHLSLGAAGGEFTHETDGSSLDDSTDAGLLRLQFEGTSRHGFGGGLRFEALRSDDDLFVDAGFSASEARIGSLFGHVTYRVAARRFAMPIRFGLMLNAYTLEENVTSDQITYASIGPYLEIAPELTLLRSRRVTWSIYGEFGAGIAVTGIDVDGDANNYRSDTGLFGVEAGTRLRLGPVEIGAAYIARWQSMAESDPEDGLVVLGYDAEFQGLLLSLGVVF